MRRRLKFDPARVSVGGDSAGGNLAAAVAIAARDTGKTKLRAQILVYPAVDLSMSGDYYGRFTKDLILTDETMQWFIDLYVPDKAMRKDWRASPLMAKSLGACRQRSFFWPGSIRYAPRARFTPRSSKAPASR